LNGGPWNPARAHVGRSRVISLYVQGASAAPPEAAGEPVDAVDAVDALAVAAEAARCIPPDPVHPAAINRTAPNIAGSRQR
jgi:hypothetical protein